MANRPAAALVRNVLVHCPETVCHACIAPNNEDEDMKHHDLCTQLEDLYEQDDVHIKCETAFKDELEQHLREDDRGFGYNVCLCRATIGDIVEMKIVPNDHRDYSGVQFAIVVPEKGGNAIFWTEKIELLKLEDSHLEVCQAGDVSIAGDTWSVYLTEIDSELMRDDYDRLYMEFDHAHYHVGKYQHMTCKFCIGEEQALQARSFRQHLRAHNKAEKEKARKHLDSLYWKKAITQEQRAAQMEQLNKAYDILPRDLELRRLQHQLQQQQRQAGNTPSSNSPNKSSSK
jgi:hypothetical protein